MSATADRAAAARHNGRADLASAVFPLDSFKRAAPHLRRPFTAAALRWKVQAQWPKNDPTAGLIVAYIDARLVIERLNLIVPHLWCAMYDPLGDAHMICRLTIDEITREDVGQAEKGDWKALYSDSLKRAAVHFGVATSVYAMQQVRLEVGEYAAVRGQQKKRLEITPNGLTWLRDRYEAWLDLKGEAAFGPALDHGDAEDAAGAEQPPDGGGEQSPASQLSPHAQNPEAKKLDRTNAEAMERLGYAPGKRQADLDAHRTLAEKRSLAQRLVREERDRG